MWETMAQARPQADVLAVEKYALTASLPWAVARERCLSIYRLRRRLI